MTLLFISFSPQKWYTGYNFCNKAYKYEKPILDCGKNDNKHPKEMASIRT